MLLFDAHLDLAWNALDWNRDLTRTVEDIRRHERDQGMTDKGRAANTVSFPAMREGRVALCLATLLARLLRPGEIPAIQRYTTMEAAYGAAHGQLGYYRAMEARGQLRMVRDVRALDAHVAAWRQDPSGSQALGFILSMEGADPILSPGQVGEWFDAGLRVVGPVHYGISPYGHGTSTEGGLFPAGRDLLREMERVGMVLDVTHLSDQGFDEAMDHFGGRMLASHHNCRALVPHQRQLTDAQIRRLIDRGAVIGMALDAWMLVPHWARGETTPEATGVTLKAMADHIDHVCGLAGNARHVAIGTDLDGGFGREQSPLDLDTIADVQKVAGILRERGYKEADIEGIFFDNWLRFFREVLPKGS